MRPQVTHPATCGPVQENRGYVPEQPSPDYKEEECAVRMRLLPIIKSTAFQTGCLDTWRPLLAELDEEFNEDASCEKGDNVVDERWWDKFEERKNFEDLEYETADEGEDEVEGYETAAEEEFLDCCEEQKERQEEVNEENGGTRMSKQETQEPRFFMMSDVRKNSYYIKGRFD